MAERPHGVEIFETVAPLGDCSRQLGYLAAVHPKTGRLLARLAANQDDPWNRVWSRYIVNFADTHAAAGTAPEMVAWTARETIFPHYKGGRTLVDDGRMEVQLGKNPRYAEMMVEYVTTSSSEDRFKGGYRSRRGPDSFTRAAELLTCNAPSKRLVLEAV